MNFRNIFTFLNAKFRSADKVKKYGLYALLIMTALAIVGGVMNSRLTKEFEELKAKGKENSTLSKVYQKVLFGEISALNKLATEIHIDLTELRGEEAVAQVAIQRLEEELELSQAGQERLEVRLGSAHEKIAEGQLTNSFLGERIVEELYNYFPDTVTAKTHLFFSETQASLFRTNPATANLIYMVILENAVRIQIIGSLSDQVTIITDLLEQSSALVAFRGEEVLAYEALVSDYDDVFYNLEAALSLERSITTNLERQIKVLTRKNFFQRVLPTLNVVVGPYYDPFRNQGGFAVALGLGWRF